MFIGRAFCPIILGGKSRKTAESLQRVAYCKNRKVLGRVNGVPRNLPELIQGFSVATDPLVFGILNIKNNLNRILEISKLDI